MIKNHIFKFLNFFVKISKFKRVVFQIIKMVLQKYKVDV